MCFNLSSDVPSKTSGCLRQFCKITEIIKSIELFSNDHWSNDECRTGTNENKINIFINS